MIAPAAPGVQVPARNPGAAGQFPAFGPGDDDEDERPIGEPDDDDDDDDDFDEDDEDDEEEPLQVAPRNGRAA